MVMGKIFFKKMGMRKVGKFFHKICCCTDDDRVASQRKSLDILFEEENLIFARRIRGRESYSTIFQHQEF